MICKIERLKPELQIPAFGEMKVFKRREVPGSYSGPCDHIAADIAPYVKLVQRESLNIKPLGRGRVAEADALAGNSIRPVAARVRAVCSGAHSRGEPASQGHD